MQATPGCLSIIYQYHSFKICYPGLFMNNSGSYMETKEHLTDLRRSAYVPDFFIQS